MRNLRSLFDPARRLTHRLHRSELPATLDPWRLQPPLTVPSGYSRDGVLESLISVSIDDSASGELKGYATADVERFLRTLDLVPQGPSRVLEIGANPYFTTLLMRKFRPQASLRLTNFFGGEEGVRTQHVRFSGFDQKEEHVDLEFHNINIEQSPLPFADDSFDVVVFCEVLEHLTNDPIFALAEINRVLAPGASLVLTTPNVARLENVLALIEGRNLYDPYSGYGPYGRHNREYTKHELHLLLQHCGFDPEISYTANVHGDTPATSAAYGGLSALCEIPNRQYDLGQYFFTRWKKTHACDRRLPSWLYRSYPGERMT